MTHDGNETLRLQSASVERRLSWVLIVILVSVFGATLQFAQERRAELKDDLAGLNSAISSKDLDSLEMIVRRGFEERRVGNRASFLEFMFAACSGLSSYDFGNEARQTELLNEFAMSVLGDTQLSIREQASFVEFLVRDPLGLNDVVWNVLRKKKAVLWLAAWHRMTTEADPNFNSSDLPMLNVPAPEGLPSGATPAAIKDARARTDYERAIEQNAAKMRRYNDQYWLKQNAQAFFKTAERYLIGAYSRPPQITQELEQLLQQYVSQSDTRDRILAAVENQKQK